MCVYLRVVWFSIIPSNQFFFSKCMSRPNKAFRPADGTFKILGFSSRGYMYFLIYPVSHIGMCQPKGYGFCAFSV